MLSLPASSYLGSLLCFVCFVIQKWRILSHLFYDACVNLLTKPDLKKKTPMRQPMSNILDEHEHNKALTNLIQ